MPNGDPTGSGSPIWFPPKTVSRDLTTLATTVTFHVLPNTNPKNTLAPPFKVKLTATPAEAIPHEQPMSFDNIPAEGIMVPVTTVPHTGPLSIIFQIDAVDANGKQATQMRSVCLGG